jgi:hypothetical protein
LISEQAEEFLKKITRLETAGAYDFTQLKTAKEPDDFRGLVLEVNFANLFVQKGIQLRYEAKQKMSGDVDFCWYVNGDHVFIEMKLLGQDQKTKRPKDQTGNCTTVEKHRILLSTYF